MSGSATWFHLSVKAIGRSVGRSVVAAAAYRLGEKLHDHELDQTHDYTRRHGVHASFTLAPEQAPVWALKPDELWNKATGAEKRKNSILAREVELALPASVTDETREAIVRQFAQTLVDRYGVAVSAAIHQPSRRGDQQNHHAHILFTTRALDENGLGKKTRVLDVMTTGAKEITWLREHAATLINAAIADAGGGANDQVDHRSYAARGMDKEATIHLGPQASEMERRGEATELGDLNRDVTQRNQQPVTSPSKKEPASHAHAAGRTRHWHEPAARPEHSAEMANLWNELAELDAEIAAVEEQRLDALYGEADPPPPSRDTDKEHGLFTFADPAPAPPPPTPAPAVLSPDTAPAVDAFDFVHNRTIARAIADDAGHDASTSEHMGERFARVRSWWKNMKEYVAGWRDEVQRHAEHLLAPWEKEEMQERATGMADHAIEPDKGLDR